MSSVDDKNFRNKVYRKIKKIKNKDVYIQIYNIILQNKQDCNVNTNGVFFDIYKISLQSVQEIDKFLNDLSINSEVPEEVESENLNYNNYSEDVSSVKKSIDDTELDKKIISHSIL
jgi:hypothetical protein